MKKRQYTWSIAARSEDPDFVPSLKLLVERERYSLNDIGLMFQVSRERVRQWVNKYKIKHPDAMHERGVNMYRRWDDELNRFIPVPRWQHNRKQHEQHVDRNKEEFYKNLANRRKKIISQIVELKKRLGRDPSLMEMASEVLGHAVPEASAGSLLAGKWGKSTYKTYKELFDDIRERSGTKPRPRGGGGPPGFCKRGHYKGSNPRCAKCMNWSAKAYYARNTGKPIPPEPHGDFTYPEKK